jgi:hypothetical protein
MRKILAIASCVFLMVNAHAQSCDAILDSRLLDESSVKNQSARDVAVAYSQCKKQGQGSSGGGHVGFKGFELGGSAASNSAMEDCSDASSQDISSYYHYAAQKGLKESAVQAWRDCMLNRENLQCWASPTTSEREVEINISWRNGSVNLPKVSSSPVTNGFVFGETVKNTLVTKNADVPYGHQKFIVVRDDDRKPLRMAMNVLLDNRISYSCSVAVPPIVRDIPKKASPQFIAECNSVLFRINAVLNPQSSPGFTPISAYPREILACASKTEVKPGAPLVIPNACKEYAKNDQQRRMLENAVTQLHVLSGLRQEGLNLSKRYGVDCPIPTY